jgi:hypothetical protein
MQMNFGKTQHIQHTQQIRNQTEIEEMRRELKSKDSLINNLKERLFELEDKVNMIQRDDKREKSQ